MKRNKLSRLAFTGLASGALVLATTACNSSMEKEVHECSGKSGCNGMKKEQSCNHKAACNGMKKEGKCSSKESCKGADSCK